jgi:hypothetical protein
LGERKRETDFSDPQKPLIASLSAFLWTEEVQIMMLYPV